MSAGLHVTVEGVGRLDRALGMVAVGDWDFEPPQVRTRFVDVPGRDGSLDLTEAMGGATVGDRTLRMRFAMWGDPEVEKARALVNLHGRALRFTISVDPAHTYVGRWSVRATTEHYADAAVLVECEVRCDPYRYRGDRILLLNPVGGRTYYLESGDKPVRPVIECHTILIVERDGEHFELTPGTYRLRGEPFRRGLNKLYLNSWRVSNTSMAYLSDLTMAELSGHTMAELQRLAGDSGLAARAMGDLSLMTMGELSRMTMRELLYKPTDGAGGDLPVDATVTVTYEWGDL